MSARPASLALIAALTLVPGVGTAAGRPPPDLFDTEKVIALSQAAIGREVTDHPFVDSNGRPLRLSDLAGKPLVVSLVFTACAESCPLLIDHLAEAVEVARDALGEDSFGVVTIGFDPVGDRPERMRAYASAHGISDRRWRFLSGEAATIDRLIEELGFLRVPSPRGFDHVAQVSILGPDRKVFAQVYGDDFAVPALVDPLKALLSGQNAGFAGLGQVIERIRLFCTFYDPRSGRYALDYSIIIGLVIGSLSLLGVATILGRAYWQAFRRPPDGLA